MIDYLALAMGQGEEENMEAAFFEIPTVEGRLPGEGPFWDEQLAQPSEAEKLGDLFSRKEAPQTPGKAPGGESFDSLSPWIPSLNDQRKGAAAPLALETSPKFPTKESLPQRLALQRRWGSDVPNATEQAWDARAERQTDASGAVEEGHIADIPLLSAMRTAERGTRFVQSQRRVFTVTLPESGGEPAGLNIESIDRAVERDARRYGGDFFLR